ELTNLILLYGPQGTGKTSAVHAVANELGWDVFEVYPGMGKRTGKDIERYVGDVARNHTIRGGGGGGGSPTKAKDLFAAFRKAGQQQGGARPPSPVKATTFSREREDGKPKQSLILFDEVDILYGEEKDFWTGFIDLVRLSRRPVIMTCTDITSIPIHDLALQ
ncbi:hypothetical protein T439DRAFT_279937, partial [Meredithblackwellia eburnea MCA 4105]